ncbi:MAG: hypothetical protein IKK70_04670 [Clostridia bacterium]|nr:hypothetical protein [Clostridia bacterium]
MKSSTKIIVASVCAILLLICAVSATLMVMIDDDSATNIFTVGKVDIKLDEAKANSDGTLVPGAERVKANDYHLLPGRTYAMDPTVTLLTNSEESYIRLIVTVNKARDLKTIYGDDFKPTDFATGYDANVWQYVSETLNEDGSAYYEYRYYKIAGNSTQDEIPLEPFITSITLSGDINNEQIKTLSGLRIIFEAHAIQASGFEGNADEAWSAFEEEIK